MVSKKLALRGQRANTYILRVILLPRMNRMAALSESSAKQDPVRGMERIPCLLDADQASTMMPNMNRALRHQTCTHPRSPIKGLTGCRNADGQAHMSCRGTVSCLSAGIEASTDRGSVLVEWPIFEESRRRGQTGALPGNVSTGSHVLLRLSGERISLGGLRASKVEARGAAEGFAPHDEG